MASLWKHPKSRYWVACWTDHTGRQRKQSTKELDKKKALKLAEFFEQEYTKTRTSAQVQKVIAGMHREITGETLAPVSILAFQEKWLAGKKAEGCADSTVVFLRHSTKRFIQFLGSTAKKPLTSITKEHLEDFRNTLAETLATKTVNHQVKGIRMMLKSAVQSGLITENPALLVRTVNTKRAQVVRKAAFRLEEIRQVLPHCDNDWKSMVLLGFFSGQRLADLQNLQWSGVSPDCGMIHLVTRKTGRTMQIPCAAPLKAHLASLTRPADPSAYIHPRLAPLKSNTLSGEFLDILIKAGIREKGKPGDKRDNSRLSFHSLRHSAVTALKEAGVPLATVMAMVGHDSEAVSSGYTKIGPDAMAAAAAAFPSL